MVEKIRNKNSLTSKFTTDFELKCHFGFINTHFNLPAIRVRMSKFKLLLVVENIFIQMSHKGRTSKEANRMSCCFITLSPNQCHHMLLLAQDSAAAPLTAGVSKRVRMIRLFVKHTLISPSTSGFYRHLAQKYI